MRLMTIVAATAMLAACGPAPGEDSEDAAQPAVQTSAANDIAGSYAVTLADGSVVIETINADGTYVDTTADGVETARGTWRQDGEAMCFDPDGDDPEACYRGGAPGPDGSFAVTDGAGKVTTSVTRRKGAVPAPAAAPAPASDPAPQ